MVQPDLRKPTFYEFFAGGGMARAGLGAGWECLFANDFDAKKRDAYVANWGGDHFHLGDIHALRANDLPGRADLAWASFPCQDLSLAGNGAGLQGERSGAFWGFWTLMRGLKSARRAPKILVLENVVGALTSRGGEDFRRICEALQSLDYVYGALTMDGVHFVPQSRPRLFILAVRKDLPMPAGIFGDAPAPPWACKALMRAQASLRKDVQRDWRWWSLPAPPKSNLRLADIVEDEPPDVKWHSPEETERFIAMMSPANLEKLREAKSAGKRVVGTIYRRTRIDENGRKSQRAEARFDNVAGCLRTPGGGSSRQFIIIVEGACIRSRLLSGREAARLMGLPDDYKLPAKYNEAYHLLGDGLCVPVIAHLNGFLFQRLLAPQEPFMRAAE